MNDDEGETATGFGEYLRAQRQLARLSLREFSRLTNVSNAYLSQIERGVHAPSVSVLTSIARALNLSTEAVLAHAAGVDPADDPDSRPDTEAVIRGDARLTSAQKEALLAVYRSYCDANEGAMPAGAGVKRSSGARAAGSSEAAAARSGSPSKAPTSSGKRQAAGAGKQRRSKPVRGE